MCDTVQQKRKTRFYATVDLGKKVKRLRAACDAAKERHSDSTIEVSYWALRDLLRYFDESRHAAEAVVRAREAMHQVFFSL